METNTHARVLVVEDDRTTADLVALYLRHAGYRAEVVHTGDDAWARLSRQRFDLLILDVMLPGINGFELCKRVQEGARTPVILLTARTREDERIQGLALGADDYVTKPFSPRELMARVAAVLRRAPPTSDGALDRGPLSLDINTMTAKIGGARMHLTVTEFGLLVELAQRPGHVCARSHLLQALPDGGRDALARTVDVHIRNLRKRIVAAGGASDLIETVSGVGYRFNEDAAT